MSGEKENKNPKLFYEKKGVGEVVVLVHGFTLDRRMWDDQFDFLAKSYQVIRYDLRGHGKSEGISERYEEADDLKGLLESLKIVCAHIVGLSLGGHIATIFTIKYPEMVRSLVIVDSAITFNPSRKFDKRVLNYLIKGVNEGFESALKDWLSDPLFIPVMKNPNVRKKMEEIILHGHLAQGQNSYFLNIANVINPRPPPEKRLNEIKIPTLVIIGELDIPHMHENADILTSGIPTAKKIIIKGAGHMSNMEKPDDFNIALLSFLSENSS